MLKEKITPFAENIAESGAACLVTMVQGNLLALGISHWVIASQTGLIAGTAAATAITVLHTEKRWIVAIVLGAITTAVDYFMHPGSFGAVATEALITGAGAAALSLLTGIALHRYRRFRATPGRTKD